MRAAIRAAEVLHVCLPAYATRDAEHAGFCTDEAAILAASGVFTDMGLNRTLLGVRASFTHLPMASVYGSMFGLCALLSEVVQGHTRAYVEVPLASALTEALVHNSIVFPVAATYVNRRKRCLLEKRFPISERELDALFDPFFTFYTCSDARKVYLVCPAHSKHQPHGWTPRVRERLASSSAWTPTTALGRASPGNRRGALQPRARGAAGGLSDARSVGGGRPCAGAAIAVRSAAEWLAHARPRGGLDTAGAPARTGRPARGRP